jgi:fructose-1,6-bisphosphatase/inositol monophosphatase family enzyme
MPLQQDYVHPMQELACEAGSLLMSYFGKVSVEYKGDADLVTQADRASEILIVERIRKQWPEHDLIGEEGSRRETGSDFRWYIDPLDGTTNFAHGYPVFCVSLALEYQGRQRRASEREFGSHRFPQPQTAQKPEHSLLSPDHAALPWRASRRVCRARPLLSGGGPL